MRKKKKESYFPPFWLHDFWLMSVFLFFIMAYITFCYIRKTQKINMAWTDLLNKIKI